MTVQILNRPYNSLDTAKALASLTAMNKPVNFHMRVVIYIVLITTGQINLSPLPDDARKRECRRIRADSRGI